MYEAKDNLEKLATKLNHSAKILVIVQNALCNQWRPFLNLNDVSINSNINEQVIPISKCGIKLQSIINQICLCKYVKQHVRNIGLLK